VFCGRAILGTPHIVDDAGAERPVGETGMIYFGGPGADFVYHNDEKKSRDARHPAGWSTCGDIGYFDADGYLYLTDRRSNIIISGGVNIYPQEVENVLALHPAVEDVAVVGVPDPEFGESVKAVVQLRAGNAAGADRARELVTYCRDRLAHYKCPKTVDFADELPRGDNGKLYKREIRDRYRSDGVAPTP
jgi:long-chain acyl-CoA synthetase